MTRIAVIGGTGQIAHSLFPFFKDIGHTTLFVRRDPEVHLLMEAESIGIAFAPIKAFETGHWDIVLNLAGPGDPADIHGLGEHILAITEKLDELILGYIDQRPDVAYVFMSSGAVYGSNYGQNGVIILDSGLSPDCHYRLAKITAEAKHRLRADRRIADIRLFGYVSPYIGTKHGFLLSELARALMTGDTFITGPNDLVRDYVGPRELAQFLKLLITADVPNGAYDVVSARPTTKFQILSHLKTHMGLSWRCLGTPIPISPPVCLARDGGKAKALGFFSEFDSLSIVERELKCALTSS